MVSLPQLGSINILEINLQWSEPCGYQLFHVGTFLYNIIFVIHEHLRPKHVLHEPKLNLSENFVRGPSESVHNLCFGNRNYSQTSKICIVSAVYAGISVGHHVLLKIRFSLVSFRAWVHNQDGTVCCAIHLCLACYLLRN